MTTDLGRGCPHELNVCDGANWEPSSWAEVAVVVVEATCSDRPAKGVAVRPLVRGLGGRRVSVHCAGTLIKRVMSGTLPMTEQV